MAAPVITPYTGEVPQRTQAPAVFSVNVNDFLTYIPPMVDEMNISTDFVNAATIVAESTNALGASIVSSTNFKGEWAGLTGALAVPSTVYHAGSYWQLLDDVADITATEPTLVNTDWAPASQSAGRTRVLSPFTLSIAGRYYIIGSDVITIPDPATLDDGIAFDFVKQPNGQPTISTGVDKTTTKLGLSDGIYMDMSQVEMVVNAGLYEV